MKDVPQPRTSQLQSKRKDSDESFAYFMHMSCQSASMSFVELKRTGHVTGLLSRNLAMQFAASTTSNFSSSSDHVSIDNPYDVIHGSSIDPRLGLNFSSKGGSFSFFISFCH